MAQFVTLDQAKGHLRITTPADDPGDAILQDQIDRAEAVILDYLKDNAPTAPDLVITQAILLTLAELDRFRGDDEGTYSQATTAGDLSPVVTNLLRRKRTPALA
jgi:hypothetical protein